MVYNRTNREELILMNSVMLRITRTLFELIHMDTILFILFLTQHELICIVYFMLLISENLINMKI